MSFLPLVRLWLWISAWATVSGWTLSIFGQLNRVGYAASLLLGMVLLWWQGRRQNGAASLKVQFSSQARKKLLKRFRRPLPLAFVLFALLVFLGGLLYPPTNHTALTYRIPRVLQWLSQEEWFWIHTSNYRMNNRACGIEWLSAPLLLFTKSDRTLFLLNFIPFLLLPGLVFSLFTRLGVRPRVAWGWMWLLPTGYTFLLQAGSTGNDTFPTVYALAAIDFASRAWASKRSSDLWHSLLAAALLTGAKASNLPLLLPWAIVFAALIPLLRSRPMRTAFMFVLAAIVSFLPTAALNWRYCGDWSGLVLERVGMDMKNPFVGLWGNALIFLLDNLVPPFFPAASWWNQNALSVLPQAIVSPLVANFESSFHWLWELPTEDWVGLGFGLSWLVIGIVVAGFFMRPGSNPTWAKRDALPLNLRHWVCIAGWLALLAYCVKSGMATGARLISPYYPLLLPLILAGSKQERIVRSRAWRWMVTGVIGLTIPALILTPARPLWPARTLLSQIESMAPGNRLVVRALNVYSVYATRNDPHAGVRCLLPADLKIVGFLGRGDDIDISFWRPYGERQVKHLLVSDTAEEIRRRGIEYVVAGEFNFRLNNTTFTAWKQQTGAELITVTNATIRVSEGAEPYYIVRFGKAQTDSVKK